MNVTLTGQYCYASEEYDTVFYTYINCYLQGRLSIYADAFISYLVMPYRSLVFKRYLKNNAMLAEEPSHKPCSREENRKKKWRCKAAAQHLVYVGVVHVHPVTYKPLSKNLLLAKERFTRRDPYLHLHLPALLQHPTRRTSRNRPRCRCGWQVL